LTRYDPLYRWLGAKSLKSEERIRLTFAEIEAVLGFELPLEARTELRWWDNETEAPRHKQCRAWLDAGFDAGKVDLKAETVEFVAV